MKINNRTLFFGDNLDVLRENFPPNEQGYFDLVYLDPPFNSNRNYSLLFKEGLQDSPAQTHAFEDSWQWTEETQTVFDELITKSSIQIINLMTGLERAIGRNSMLAYLSMMAIRLIECHRVLKYTGTLYLHCDPTASHYIKLVLDKIFGVENFRNEIIWFYPDSPGRPTKDFARKHDVIFRYSKTNEWVFEDKDIRVPILEASKERYKSPRTLGGRKYLGGKSADIGKIPEDVWRIPVLKQNSQEAQGYPTQKPMALMEIIIKASSKKGDWVLDPFCGCGTTISAAEKHNRNWVGIDITPLATDIIKNRIEGEFKDKLQKEKAHIIMEGIPNDLAGAEKLAEMDKFKFQLWVVRKIGAIPNVRKGADQGVDGVFIYEDIENGKKKNRRLIVSVKGGGTGVKDIRDLKGVIERENAEGGIFISLNHPTPAMKKEAIVSGLLKNQLLNKQFPKVQILTVEEIMN